jgi:hypothetical protein
MNITRYDIVRAVGAALHDLAIYGEIDGEEYYAGHVDTVRTWPDTATDVVEFDLTTGRTVKIKVSFPRRSEAREGSSNE